MRDMSAVVVTTGGGAFVEAKPALETMTGIAAAITLAGHASPVN